MSATDGMMTIGEELSFEEGRKRIPFKDSLGRWCCGVGCDLQAHGLLTKQGAPTFKSWTDAEIDAHLNEDVLVASHLVMHHLPWSANLDLVRARVLLNMMFQLGWDDPATLKHEGLSGFVNTLAALRKGNWEAASEGILTSLYARQVPARAHRMAFRIKTGIYKVPETPPIKGLH